MLIVGIHKVLTDGYAANGITRRTRKATRDDLMRTREVCERSQAASDAIRKRAGLDPVPPNYFRVALAEAIEAHPPEAEAPASAPPRKDKGGRMADATYAENVDELNEITDSVEKHKAEWVRKLVPNAKQKEARLIAGDAIDELIDGLTSLTNQMTEAAEVYPDEEAAPAAKAAAKNGKPKKAAKKPPAKKPAAKAKGNGGKAASRNGSGKKKRVAVPA